MGRPKSAALEDATAINTMQATPTDKTFFIETPQITRAYLHNVYDGKNGRIGKWKCFSATRQRVVISCEIMAGCMP